MGEWELMRARLAILHSGGVVGGRLKGGGQQSKWVSTWREDYEKFNML